MASRVSYIADVLLKLVGFEQDPKKQEALVSAAMSIASATAALVTNAWKSDAENGDQESRDKMVMEGKRTALTIQKLIIYIKVRTESKFFDQF